MALKLGKCRLCLKLGDFYSIFTLDNSVQLADMVMECARIKVFEGDGLPDKVCSECIQKLSSAYIFKQQCERADQELRRSFIPPPGLSISPPPQTRQSSDSALSLLTDTSNHTKPSSEVDPSKRNSRKRSHDSEEDESISTKSHEIKPTSSKRVEELRKSYKKPKRKSDNYYADLDYEALSASQFSVETDSDESLVKDEFKCKICGKQFHSAKSLGAHSRIHSRNSNKSTKESTLTEDVVMSTKKAAYLRHIKDAHFEPRLAGAQEDAESVLLEAFECRMCSKRLPTEKLLITHLAAHVSNIEGDDESRPSTIDDSSSMLSDNSGNGPLQCNYCDKRFKYKKSLVTHELKHSHEEVKTELEAIHGFPSTSREPGRAEYRSESESSGGSGNDNTCDICEKQFSYKRLLVHHKRTKHNMSSGTKRAAVALKDCLVRCLICDLDMTVNAVNEHNQKHIQLNMKPRNLYTCIDCGEKFKSRSVLANHIKLVHRLKQIQPKQFKSADLADFCEVVVTKAEPLDQIQSHNGFGEVPEKQAGSLAVDLSGFTCTICGKTMPTLISLKRHVNWHSNVGNNLEKKLECFVCNESFRFQRHYKLHMREHYSDTNLDPKLLTCSICNRKSKHLRAAQAHMNYHKQTRFKNKDYQCSICKRVFQYRKVYLSHMAIHYKRGESQNTIVGDVLPNTADKTVFDGTHTCTHCGKVCDSENSLKHHISWHKSKSLLFGSRHECPVCLLMFTNKKRQELHTRTHYEDDNGPFKCTICGKGYTDENYFRKHVKGHNFDHQSHKKRIEKLRKNKIKCPICVRYYPDWMKLIRHLRRTHPESKMVKAEPGALPARVFTCKLCARVCRDERALRLHEEAHLRKPAFFKCKFCGKKTISLKNHNLHIKSHLTTKHVDNPLPCPHCDQCFVKGYDLHYHLRDEHNINETWIADRTEQRLDGPLKEFQCSICLKILASKGNYERHLDYHNSLRCNYCYDYFSSLRFLEGHLTYSCDKKKLVGGTEIYSRKLKCHICYKAFHLQVKLDCHLQTQHGIKVLKEASKSKKDLVCDYCFRVFENVDALSTHKIYHRTVGYFGCIYCNRKFNTMTLFRKHKNHHFAQLNVDNPTKCEHCDDTFVPFRKMIYHMRDVHGDTKEWLILPKESIEETCPICNKVFFNLHRHLDYHEENRCKKCGEYFYSRTDFDNHLCAIDSDVEPGSVDLDIRPNYEECRFCFKPITRKSSKRKHDHIHKGSGSISCRFCSHKFKTMDAFNIHAFSHRNRKYKENPLKCGKCGEKFIKYGPFIKHLKEVHKSVLKMHYRATVKAERCVVCGEQFPNLHNHYRAHLLNRCAACLKYFTSARAFAQHDCARPDADPAKVFISGENLPLLIQTYVPKDEKDEQKYYGHTQDEEHDGPAPREVGMQGDQSTGGEPVETQCPVISDVLSLSHKQEARDWVEAVIDLDDDDDEKTPSVSFPIIIIDD